MPSLHAWRVKFQSYCFRWQLLKLEQTGSLTEKREGWRAVLRAGRYHLLSLSWPRVILIRLPNKHVCLLRQEIVLDASQRRNCLMCRIRAAFGLIIATKSGSQCLHISSSCIFYYLHYSPPSYLSRNCNIIFSTHLQYIFHTSHSLFFFIGDEHIVFSY